MNWFKLHTEARNDAKLRTLTVQQRWCWFCLLCYAAEQKQRGTFSTDRMRLLAIEVADGDCDLLADTIAALSDLDIVAVDGSAGRFVHFEERQYDKPSDHPAEVGKRVKKHRELRAAAASFISADDGNALPGVTPRFTKSVTRESRTEQSSVKAAASTGAARETAAPSDCRCWFEQEVGRAPDKAELKSLEATQSWADPLPEHAMRYGLREAAAHVKKPSAFMHYAISAARNAPPPERENAGYPVAAELSPEQQADYHARNAVLQPAGHRNGSSSGGGGLRGVADRRTALGG